MTSIQMPQLGETIVEGTILKWLKNEGDQVKADEPLFEISTDKVDTEVPSPVAGTVTKLLVAEGTTVPVGTAVMEIDDGSGTAGNGSSAPAATETPTAAPAPTPAQPPAQAPAQAPAPQAIATPAPAMPDRGPRSNILSPIVRKLARESDIDLATVAGTGEGGRITKADVLAATSGATAQPPTSAATVTPLPSVGPAAAAVMVAPPSMPAGQGEESEPMSHIRKAIATHMLASTQQTARAWTMVEVNVDRLVRLREDTKEKFQANYGVKLTYLPMVARATIDALQQFPLVNSRIDGENIVTPRFVNMGIAVSYDAGLIVPVVKGADGMNTIGIARAIADLAARARSHQLQPDEVQGATFTITNPGPYGSLLSVPIINQPNAGILSLDAIQKRPVVVEDDAIAVRSMVYISMSWDHRLIDGELATRFLARVKHNLETWDFAEDLGL
ncbi:MAG TPA: 2-oxoglutarate dehydrogenase, E2 component, dihydrolipoamide succinyltransferase [Actinomycetota bacterium]|nr:2-oxoglutarate dehydrogenase, E2 component, dihydrolipoamide succinyltransferase [Actinomycetota bacterium]